MRSLGRASVMLLVALVAGAGAAACGGGQAAAPASAAPPPAASPPAADVQAPPAADAPAKPGATPSLDEIEWALELERKVKDDGYQPTAEELARYQDIATRLQAASGIKTN